VIGKSSTRKLAVIALCGGLLAACGTTSTTSAASKRPSSSTANVTIKVLASPTTGIGYLEKHTAEFTKKTGIKVQYTLVPYADLENKAVLALTSSSDPYDVVETYTEMAPTLIKGHWIEPLAAVAKQVPKTDRINIAAFLPNYEKFFSNSAGKAEFVLSTPDTRVFWYSKPLLTKYHLPVPKTWRQLEADAATITKHSPGTYGFMASTAEDGWAVLTWIPVIYSTGQGVFTKTGCPEVTTPKAVDATRFYVDMVRKYGPVAARSYTIFNIQPYMAKGTLAFADVDTSATPFAQKGKMVPELFPKPTSGTKRYAGGEIGGWAYGITKSSAHKVAAYKWLRWATDSQNMLGQDLSTVSTGRAPGRIALYSNSKLLTRYPLFKLALKAVERAKSYAPYPNEPTIASDIDTTLSGLLTSGSSVRAGLNTLQAELLKTMRSIGLCKS